MEKVNLVKEHFESEAKEFDGIILNLIPYYNQMIESLVMAIPFEVNDRIKVIDLGCGTGTISKKVKERFLNAEITCVDLAESMLKMSKEKLKNFEGISYKQGDFNEFEFEENYHVVISSLALHHLETDEDKKKFYKKIYKALDENGVFYNADVIIGENSYNQELFMEKWKEFMAKNVGIDEIENKWIPKYLEEDKPTKINSHKYMLENIGFSDFDVLWKYYNFAVFGATKKR